MSAGSIALVTGAAGFLGSELVRQLHLAGTPVRAFVRSAERARRILPPDVEIVEGDVVDEASVRRAMRGVGVVYHLASTFRTARTLAAEHRRVHVDGTRHVLQAALDEGASRVVHCSTCGVHGDVAEIPATEETAFAPSDDYQRTKLEGELLARDFGREHGLEVAVVRPTMLYGPGDLRMLKMFRGIQRGRFPLIGWGKTLTHYGYGADVVRGMRLAATVPAAAGEAFLLGGNEILPLDQVCAMIAEAVGASPPRLRLPAWPFFAAGAACEAICIPLGIEPPIYRRRVAFFTKNRAFSIEKARRILGYEPEVSLAQGIRCTAAWYRDQGLLDP